MPKGQKGAAMTPFVTVLMPCLNEAETLADCIRAARAGLLAANVQGEVLVADNGSTDGSPEIARELGAHVIHVPERGYGSALRAGMEAAAGEWIVMGDADRSYDFSQIAPFLEKLRSGADLVMGCRLPAGGGKIAPGAMPWKHRWIGNPVLTAIGRMLFGCPSHDFHCGLRALTKDAFRKMELRTPGMEFASEMVIKASLRGLRIEETPITLHKDGRSRPPHLRSWRDGWRHLRFMLLFSPRWLLLYPGIVLSLLGAAAFVRLLMGPIQIGDINFDLNTLEIAGLVLLFGYQMILFALFARVFAFTRGFLPKQPLLSRAMQIFSLERGLVLGGVIFLIGMIVIVFAAFGWAATGFGDLDPLTNTRVVIAGRTLASIGAQTVLFSLIFSYLGIDTPSGDAAPGK